jgi:hypothetical protein
MSAGVTASLAVCRPLVIVYATIGTVYNSNAPQYDAICHNARQHNTIPYVVNITKSDVSANLTGVGLTVGSPHVSICNKVMVY